MEKEILIPAQQEGRRTFCWGGESTCRAQPLDWECQVAQRHLRVLEVGRFGRWNCSPLLPNSINSEDKLISMLLPGNLIKISGPGCYMRINKCQTPLQGAVCGWSHGDHIEITTPELLICVLGYFHEFIPSLSRLNLKKIENKKAEQNHNFPLAFIEMSFEWEQTMLSAPLGNWYGQKSIRTRKLQLWST